MSRYGSYKIGTLVYHVFEIIGSTVVLTEDTESKIVWSCFATATPFEFVTSLMRNNAVSVDDEFKGDVNRFINESKTVLDKVLISKNKGRYLDDKADKVSIGGSIR